MCTVEYENIEVPSMYGGFHNGLSGHLYSEDHNEAAKKMWCTVECENKVLSIEVFPPIDHYAKACGILLYWSLRNAQWTFHPSWGDHDEAAKEKIWKSTTALCDAILILLMAMIR